jgi:hypothetical protein
VLEVGNALPNPNFPQLHFGEPSSGFTLGLGSVSLLVVRSPIVNLTLSFSFDHNLCFICPNGSCKPTLDIYVPRVFQWYKEHSNPMGFDPYNHFLKIWESTETPTPKMGAHLGMWVFILSHSPTLSTSWEHEMWLPASLLVRTLTSPCLGREPKAGVATVDVEKGVI